jgi:type VI protein secretion system component VasK
MAATWTVIAILGAFSLGVLAFLAAQHGRLDARLDVTNGRIDELRRELRGEMRELRGEMGELREEMRAFRQEMGDEIRRVIGTIEGRVARHEAEQHGA